MAESAYESKRAALTHYFDQTSLDKWAALTSDAPLSGVRATVRDGRDSMMSLMLDWLPGDLQGVRVLDAGCGTGILSCQLARRGAEVVGVDVSPRLIDLARQRLPAGLEQQVQFAVGDMCDEQLGQFDYIVAMDSMIHYTASDVEDILARFAQRAKSGLLFTVAPSTPLLRAMHVTGRLFPSSERAPDIQPIRIPQLIDQLASGAMAAGRWRLLRDQRVDCGFYKSHGLYWVRP